MLIWDKSAHIPSVQRCACFCYSTGKSNITWPKHRPEAIGATCVQGFLHNLEVFYCIKRHFLHFTKYKNHTFSGVAPCVTLTTPRSLLPKRSGNEITHPCFIYIYTLSVPSRMIPGFGDICNNSRNNPLSNTILNLPVTIPAIYISISTAWARLVYDYSFQYSTSHISRLQPFIN